MSFLGESLEALIQIISKFPGLGPRSAQRIILHLLKHKNQLLQSMVDHFLDIHRRYHPCAICGYMDERMPCFFCTSLSRDPQIICIVANTGDIWALERSAFFKGQYHVLGGLLSAMSSIHPEDLSIEGLLDRLGAGIVQEVIVALDGTLEGQTTMHYLAQEIEDHFPEMKISCLARGIPMGGELCYLDQGTLMNAFLGRKNIQRSALTAG